MVEDGVIMSVVKRMFRQQSARVASSSSCSSFNHPSSTACVNELDADEEEEKSLVSARDDIALILSQPSSKPVRRPPSHSNSFVCLFNERMTSGIARGFSMRRSARTYQPPSTKNTSNSKRDGLIFRTASTIGRFRSATARPGQLVAMAASDHDRSYVRTATFDDLAYFGRSMDGYRLTAQQRSLIRQCWLTANGRGKSGESAGSFVLRWLFKREPRLRRIFDLDSIPLDHLSEDPRFQKYAKTFSDMLEMVVDSVGGDRDTTSLLDDTMGPFLCSYGAEQALMETRNLNEKSEVDTFRSSDWDLLATAMREFASESWRLGGSWAQLGSYHRRNDALHAWHVLVHFIVTKVKRGYELEKENMNLEPKISLSGNPHRL